MRITKRQLKRIIKEEKAKLLKENTGMLNDHDLIEVVSHTAEKLGLTIFVPPEMDETAEISDAQQDALEIARELIDQLRVVEQLIQSSHPSRRG
jgi:hydroxymethylpyrimidine/phosphomethylpyrimidine kinase